jgi:anti-sigma factor RsiW
MTTSHFLLFTSHSLNGTMINTEHLSNQLLQEYTLDLLPRSQRRQVEQHTAVCPTCRHTLAQETAVATLVHNTLYRAAQPAPAQLERMRPAVPRQPVPAFQLWMEQVAIWLYGPLRQPVALAGLLLILLFGGLSLHQSTTGPAWASPSPTYMAATATNEPTATQTVDLTGTAVPIAYQENNQPILSPTPEVTPVALSSNYK